MFRNKRNPSVFNTFIIFFAAILFFLPAQAWTSGYNEITAPEAREMLKNPDTVIVNNLSAIEFELQHIPGSINIPINQINDLSRLPTDSNTPLIFYCMAPK